MQKPVQDPDSLNNFFDDLPDAANAEIIQQRCESTGGFVERIVTRGQITPPGEWLDQSTDEWVLLLRGAARLQFEDQADEIRMRPGDELWIPAGCRHRVAWTPSDQTTLWLAVHFEPRSMDC